MVVSKIMQNSPSEPSSTQIYAGNPFDVEQKGIDSEITIAFQNVASIRNKRNDRNDINQCMTLRSNSNDIPNWNKAKDLFKKHKFKISSKRKQMKSLNCFSLRFTSKTVTICE